MLRDEVKSKTCVPVPQVLARSSKSESGPVESEYIIKEHVSGVALNEIWSQMPEVQHIKFIDGIGKLAKELCILDIGALGSLYFNTANNPPEAHPIDEEYCIGPHWVDGSVATATGGKLKPRFLWGFRVLVSCICSVISSPSH